MAEELFQPQLGTDAPQLCPSNATDDEDLSTPLDRLSLPKDAELPPIIREVVTNAPKNRKLASFIACLSPLCALASRVRLKYYYDSRPSALLLQVLIEGQQSAGKSFAADIEDLIMARTLKARDKAQRRLEQEYREKKKRRSQNKQMEEEPQTTIRVIPPTISKTVLTRRADFYERILGDTLTFWMFAEELAQVTDAGKAGYSNLRTIMRTAYDLGSLFGIDYASDNSYSAIVDINICSMFCTTPSALDEYMDKKAIEGGNITRCIVCPIDDHIGSDGAIFRPYTPEQLSIIQTTLNRLMDHTYNDEGELQPTETLDTSWLDNTVRKWCKQKGKEAALSGSEALNVFRKRSSVSAFRVASLCYFLYQIEADGKSPLIAQKRAKQIYLFMAEYVLSQLLAKWGSRFEELNAKRISDTTSKPKLYDLCPETFTRDQLRTLVKQQNLLTPVRIFIAQWKSWGAIEIIDKNTFKKTSKK